MEAGFNAIMGSKVILRPFQLSDITAEYISWLNNPHVVKYSNQRFFLHTEQSCRKYFDSFANTENLFISIRRQSDDMAVGTMTAYLSPHHNTADIGIMIGVRDVWGQGIGQDAWDTLLKWLIHERRLRKVTAGTLQSNQAMIKLMERSGMIKEGTLAEQELLDGIPQDIVNYAKFGNS